MRRAGRDIAARHKRDPLDAFGCGIFQHILQRPGGQHIETATDGNLQQTAFRAESGFFNGTQPAEFLIEIDFHGLCQWRQRRIFRLVRRRLILF